MVKIRLASPRRMLREFQRTYRDWVHLLEAFPRDVGTLLRRVGAGTFELHLEHRRLEQTVNRLVQGVLISALMLSSSLLWASKAEPTIWDVSVVGALGFGLAALLATRLVYKSRNRGDDEQ